MTFIIARYKIKSDETEDKNGNLCLYFRKIYEIYVILFAVRVSIENKISKYDSAVQIDLKGIQFHPLS
jgi:hypothetical protein